MRLGKYNTAYTFVAPVLKAGDTAFAASADWTPAVGDVKISKDGAAMVDIATLPTAVTGPGSKQWSFSLSETEMQAANIVIQVVDTALEDSAFEIFTFGNAAAYFAFDLDVATQNVNVASMDNDTITSNVFAASAINATAIAGSAITAGKFAADAITNAAIADNAINATSIASNAIGASELATDAVTEIAQGVLDIVVESRADANITLEGVLRLLLAYAAGRRSGNDYLTPDNTLTRISGTVSGGDRTAVTLNTTD